MGRQCSEYRKARQRFKISEKRRELKLKAIAYKGGSCSVCGYNKCPGALIFHHINPDEKDFGISHNGSVWKFDLIKDELDKCILVCANCHAEIHAEHHELNRQSKFEALEKQKPPPVKPSLNKECFKCKRPIKVFASHIKKRNFCSRQCSDSVIYNDGWPENNALLDSIAKSSVKQVAKELNKSLSSVYDRLSKIRRTIKN